METKTKKDLNSNDMYWSYCIGLLDFVNLAHRDDINIREWVELANRMSESRFLLLARSVDKPSFKIKFDTHEGDDRVVILYKDPKI